MSPLQLQHLMIINKSQQLHWKVKTKTLLMDLATWGLWMYIFHFILTQFSNIISKPVFEGLLFVEIIGAMLSVAAALVLLTIMWSGMTKTKLTAR